MSSLSIYDKAIKAVVKRRLPVHQPWQVNGGSNAVTDKLYHGVNTLILAFSVS